MMCPSWDDALAFPIESVPNRSGKPAILLREAWREGRRIRQRTVAHLSRFPPEVIEGFRAVLKGAVAVRDIDPLIQVERSWGPGQVAAVLGMARALGLERCLHRDDRRERQLALAAIVARVLSPDSQLATARQRSPQTATSRLGAMLGLGAVSGNEVLGMLDWLLARQPGIERHLARQHLQGGTLMLYDVSSSYLEGTHCPLAEFGDHRDGKAGKRQIVYGLLCAADGCPVAIEVFPGNPADPKTVVHQINKIRRRFGIHRLAWVGDRRMLTTARIREDLEPAGLDWISALKTPDIRPLLQHGAPGEPAPLVPETLIPDAIAEVTGPDFPGERLIVCLNPRLQTERRRQRQARLRATAKALERIAASVRSGRLKGVGAIERRVGQEIPRHQVAKHFEIQVTDRRLVWRQRPERIIAEARLDGIDVIRTSLEAETLGAAEAVEAYKRLAGVERAFRSMKSDLRIRPIHVYSADQVRAHIFLCMLAYYVEWHLRQRLAPMGFEDDDRAAAQAARDTPVAPAQPSPAAQSKAATRVTAEGLPVHSFRTRLDDLASLALNQVRLRGPANRRLTLVTQPTAVQKRAFELLGVKPDRGVPINMTD